MSSSTEQEFFQSFSDFKLQESEPISSAFYRLANLKNWQPGSEIFRSFWRACFGEDAVVQPPPENKHQTPSMPNGKPITPGYGTALLEESLRLLNLQRSGETDRNPANGATYPESSVSDDGVRIRYFDTFPGFDTDNTAPIQEEFSRLAIHQRWKSDTQVYHDQFIRCCGDEFKFFCGDSNAKLEAWQTLVTDVVGLLPAPTSLGQCKKALRGHFVNIFDYIDSKRAGVEVSPVFTTISSFRKYTRRNGKVFPKAAAKENPFLSILLEKLFAFSRESRGR